MSSDGPLNGRDTSSYKIHESRCVCLHLFGIDKYVVSPHVLHNRTDLSYTNMTVEKIATEKTCQGDEVNIQYVLFIFKVIIFSVSTLYFCHS